MSEGYDCRRDGDCTCAWLDEWLCEYVDGTMDPAVRRSFEEYLSINPALAEQVAHLRETRSLLCRHGGQMPTPEGLEARIRRRLACEMLRTQPPFVETATRLGTFAAYASVMVLMMMAGMLVGAEVYQQRETAAATARINQALVEPERRAGMTPLMGQAPLRRPRFADRAAPVLRPPHASFLTPALFERSVPAVVAAPRLQRTGVAP